MEKPALPGKGGQQRAGASSQEKPATTDKKASGGCGCLAVGAILIAVSVSVFGSCSGESGSGGPSGDSNIEEQVRQDEATDTCREWVKDKLKSPSSAQFSDENVSGDQTGYTIVGAVDADNSFGASLRNTWTCSVRLDGDTWRGTATLLDAG